MPRKKRKLSAGKIAARLLAAYTRGDLDGVYDPTPELTPEQIGEQLFLAYQRGDKKVLAVLDAPEKKKPAKKKLSASQIASRLYRAYQRGDMYKVMSAIGAPILDITDAHKRGCKRQIWNLLNVAHAFGSFDCSPYDVMLAYRILVDTTTDNDAEHARKHHNWCERRSANLVKANAGTPLWKIGFVSPKDVETGTFGKTFSRYIIDATAFENGIVADLFAATTN